MTFFTDNPLERLMVQMPEAPRRAVDPPAVVLPEAIGVCPRCGGRVVETQKAFSCETTDCGFALWKNSRFFTAKRKQLTKAIVAALLKEGSVLLRDCYSEKSGKTYDATVALDDTGKSVNYIMLFDDVRGNPISHAKTKAKPPKSKGLER